MPIARFIEPMLLLPSSALPEGANVSYQAKWDGYRAIAIKSGGRTHLVSWPEGAPAVAQRQGFTRRYPAVVSALAALPDETIVDREVVALDVSGRPSFNALQNSRTAEPPSSTTCSTS